MGGEKPLERHEDHDQDRQPQREPQDLEQESLEGRAAGIGHESCPGESSCGEDSGAAAGMTPVAPRNVSVVGA